MDRRGQVIHGFAPKSGFKIKILQEAIVIQADFM
jgi:hypothetical protein